MYDFSLQRRNSHKRAMSIEPQLYKDNGGLPQENSKHKDEREVFEATELSAISENSLNRHA
jgi:hypothetical protein